MLSLLFALLLGPAPEQQVLFRSGELGYHTYRIPSLIATKNGTLLAFAEARRDGSGDSGTIHTVVRRSTDGGRTWNPQQVAAAHGDNTLGNPCPVVDRATGVIWLLLTGNPGDTREDRIIRGEGSGTRTVWVSRSADDGLTWAEPSEITRDVKLPNWTWYATGPGNGIQLKNGRLLIPANHAELETRTHFAHVIYSDDHGATWKLGGTVGPETNESTVVELRDGSLLINMRNLPSKGRRAVSRSRDRGATWSPVTFDETLIEPTCQASLVRDGNVLLFSNPADPKRRVRMTVRLSRDGGRSWPVSRVVHEGPSAYSSLTPLRNGGYGLLFEKGEKVYHETITFVRFPRRWLEGK